MNWTPSFTRKVIYIVAMIPPLLAIAWLGLPATSSSDGGKLSKLREKHELSQANLGDIDPASETMKLASLGMQGVATNILWSKANNYKMKEDWDNLSATLNQITKLQPNFIGVWEFQGHNLSYNISVEFDDYRHRYQWVTKGIEFLMGGTRYNRNEPRLFASTGWFFGQKIGISDEHKEYRQLFREDNDFHDVTRTYVSNLDDAYGHSGYDNWLVGKLWYLKAQAIVKERGTRSLKGKNPLIFHSKPAMSLINYAQAVEEDFRPDEVARRDWEEALKAWSLFGNRAIPSSWGHPIVLKNKDTLAEEGEDLRVELDAIVAGLSDKDIQLVVKNVRDARNKKDKNGKEIPLETVYQELRKSQDKYKSVGVAREQMLQEKRKSLSKEELEALNTPPLKRTFEHTLLVQQANPKLLISDELVAEKSPPTIFAKARRKALEILAMDEKVQRVDSYRRIVNYEYWEIRCQAEASEQAIAARQLLFDAEQLYSEKRPDISEDDAIESYEKSWKQWAKVYEQYPLLLKHHTAEDIIPSIVKYRNLLDKLNLPFPKDFPLQNLIDIYTKKKGDPFSRLKRMTKPDASLPSDSES